MLSAQMLGRASAGVSAQMTSSGTSLVDQGNASKRIIAPAGITRGIPFRGGSNDALTGETLIRGRLALGFVELVLILLVLFYVSTRHVQGGG